MKISVITPTRNGAQFLRNCIESVRCQPGNVEHIVIDGDSSDQTLTILGQYDHIKWLSEPDQGIYDAVNKGIAMADGDIVGYLNADDRLAADALSRVMAVFEKRPEIDFVYGACTYIDDHEKELFTYRPPRYSPALLKNMKEVRWSQPGSFWRKRIFDSLGAFDTSLKYSGDYDFFLRLILSRANGLRINSVLSYFMLREAQLSVTAQEAMVEEYHRIEEKYRVKRNRLLGALGEVYFRLINVPVYVRWNYLKTRLEALK